MTGKYSYDALMQFMDWVIEKGLLNKQTASSRKTAAQQVLQVLDGAEREDLRAVSIDDVFMRFQNLNRSRYTPESLKVYRSRFASALEAFLNHAEDPSSFKATGAPKKTGAGNITKVKSGTVKKKPPSIGVNSAAQSTPTQVSEAVPDGHLTLPIPLRPGLMVKIFGLPADLSDDEARKICAVVSAYITQK